jgi:HemY protein
MSLGRALVYFLKLAIVIAAAVWLANRPGAMTVHWFGHRIDMPVGLAIGLVVLAFLALFALWRLWRFLRAPAIRHLPRQQRQPGPSRWPGPVAVAAAIPERRRLAKSARDLLGGFRCRCCWRHRPPSLPARTRPPNDISRRWPGIPRPRSLACVA